jgi:hypothetical protein
MTGGLASLDAWIQRNGNGWVFAAVAELQVDDFLDFASAESEVHESCEASLDAEWIRSITERLSEWQRDTNFLTVESRRANAQGIIDLLTDDASSNCAKASVLLPILLWLTSIQARHDALKDQGESFAPDIEELDDIFVAIAEEYQTLHLTK